MILLIDDNENLLAAFQACLRINGLPSKTCYSVSEALDYLDKNLAPKLILLDFAMPRLTGEDFMDGIKDMKNLKSSSTKIIGMSCYAPDYVGITRFKSLVHEYIEKPASLKEFMDIVHRYYC